MNLGISEKDKQDFGDSGSPHPLLRQQLMVQQGRFVVSMAFGMYVICQGMAIAFVEWSRRNTGEEKSCAGEQQQCSSRQDNQPRPAPPAWLLQALASTTTCFFGYAILTMWSRSKLLKRRKYVEETPQQQNQQQPESRSFGGVEAITLCAGSSHFLQFMYAEVPTAHLTDWFGLESSIFRWPEWAMSVPLLMYIIIAVDVKDRLSKRDIKILACLFCTIVAGAALNTCASDTLAVFFILFSFSCFGTVLFFNWQRRCEFSRRLRHLRTQQGDAEAALLMANMLRVSDMSEVYFISTIYFPIFSLLGWCKVLSSSQVQFLFAFGSLFCNLGCCHVLADSTLQYDREAAEQSQKTLRLTLSNLAHDLKTPLAGFSSGLLSVEEEARKLQEVYNDSNKKNGGGAIDLDPESVAAVVTPVTDAMIEAVDDLKQLNSYMLLSINRYIDFVKASRGMTLVPKYDFCAMQDVLDMSKTCMSKVVCSASQITFLPLSPPLSPFIFTDKQWLLDNIFCLLSNAVKYSDEGEILVSASLANFTVVEERGAMFGPESPSRSRSRSEEGCKHRKSTDNTSGGSHSSSSSFCVLFEVSDCGIGLPNNVSNLFGSFQQLQKKAGGTGLGLYSMAKRLDALGGFYGAENRRDEEQGSVFWFAFPYRPCDAPESTILFEEVDGRRKRAASTSSVVVAVAPIPPPTPVVVAVGAAGKKVVAPLHILLVEDSYTILKMTQLALARAGHTVMTALNGSAALKIATDAMTKSGGKPPFDLVLCDICMPVMDGFEFVTRFRAFEEDHVAEMKRLLPALEAASSATTVGEGCQATITTTVDGDQSILLPELSTAAVEAAKTLCSGSMSSGATRQLIFGLSADDNAEDDAIAAGMDSFMAKPFKLTAVQELLIKYGKYA